MCMHICNCKYLSLVYMLNPLPLLILTYKLQDKGKVIYSQLHYYMHTYN